MLPASVGKCAGNCNWQGISVVVEEQQHRGPAILSSAYSGIIPLRIASVTASVLVPAWSLLMMEAT